MLGSEPEDVVSISDPGEEVLILDPEDGCSILKPEFDSILQYVRMVYSGTGLCLRKELFYTVSFSQ
jgi:hypothetical protein